MIVFITWSGERSRMMAEAIHDWLPSVIQSVVPFLSAEDIDKGARWLPDLTAKLGEANFGIVCLTPENIQAPWILFEAGAISKTSPSRVATYLFAIEGSLEQPLGQFQSTRATEMSETFALLRSINGSLDRPLPEAVLKDVFESMWPKLQARIGRIPTNVPAPPKRPDLPAMVEEILGHVRKMSSEVRRPPDDLETLYSRLPASGRRAFIDALMDRHVELFDMHTSHPWLPTGRTPQKTSLAPPPSDQASRPPNDPDK